MRRVVALALGVCLFVSLMTAIPAGATPTAVPSSDYVDRVNDVLRRTDDHWGEKLMKLPDGPSYESLASLLVPAMQANTFLTDSASAYLPLTYPIPQPNQWGPGRPFSLHVIDGSQILTDWAEGDAHARRRTATFITNGETYGAATDRLSTPDLAGGHLPILANSYTDATGTRWDRESFVGRANGNLVSWVKFTVFGSGTKTLRIRLVGDGVSTAVMSGNRLNRNGLTHLAWAARSVSWAEPNLTVPITAQPTGTSVYFVIPNHPSALGTTPVNAAAYDGGKSAVATYWNDQLSRGAQIDIPETYASQAMRNLLIQNLVMGWQQSVGNGYEFKDSGSAFVPEVSASVQVLGEFGHQDAWRRNLQEILRRGQGWFFPTWEMGHKLQSAASYYLMTGDASYLQHNLPTFNSYLNTMVTQRNHDPHGLLAKTRYGSDIPQPVYGVHHQSNAWRGLRDLGVALRVAGLTGDANRFTAEANDFERSLRAAITASQTWLPDGALYVPASLLDPAASPPYDQITSTRDGSYWNLIIGYFLQTGLFRPGSAEANGMARYLYTRGGLVLGLTRFNLTGTDPGVCWAGGDHFGDNAPGYKASGVDEQYGYSRIKFLSDNQQTDRLTLNLYGKLAHDLTPQTFIGGEGATIGHCPELGEAYRTQFYPPLSANNASYLEALRSTLVREQLATDGTPTELWLAPATPRQWLTDGKHVAVTSMPTQFGPVSYRIDSKLDQQIIDATVTPPPRAAGRAVAQKVRLTLRAPAGNRLTSVTVNGVNTPFTGETVDLGPLTARAAVRATYQPVAVPRNDQAEVTLTNPGRKIYQPGQQATFTATVEALGTGSVDGTVSLTVPSGWTAPAAQTFSVASNGKLAWAKLTFSLTVPSTAALAEHTVNFVTTPSAGTATTTPVKVRVARPVAESYSDMIRGDQAGAYWRLGETTGLFADSSGNGVAATPRASVARGQAGAIAGDADGSVRLTGGYVDTPHALSVTPSGPATFEAWVKVEQGYQQGLIEKYTAPGRNGFALRLEARNAVKLYLLNGSGITSVITGKQSILPGQWHHIVVAYDRAWMDIYVDGKIDFRAPVNGGMPTVGVSPLRIGARGDDAAFRLNGVIDEVALYGHPLLASQVEEHFLKGVLGARR